MCPIKEVLARKEAVEPRPLAWLGVDVPVLGARAASYSVFCACANQDRDACAYGYPTRAHGCDRW